jgi:hypothetical protein
MRSPVRAFLSLAAAVSLSNPTEPTPADRRTLRTVVQLERAAIVIAFVSGVGLLVVGQHPINEPMPSETSRMIWTFLAGAATSVVAGLPLVALAIWRRMSRRWGGGGLQRLLEWLPPSMRDDAEGLMREFADVRDRDRARGGAPWLTLLKCGWFLTVYVLRTAIGLAFAALIGRLLRL